ncbi:MAG: alkaline phosphatase D family protein [Burkholderiales bacterium]|nr:alkaline phosphatase D family protein [Burkholderiales bacterium]
MTSRREALKTVSALPLATLPGIADAAPAMPGPPLAGHFTHESVRLWLQATEPAVARVRYWQASGAESEAKSVDVALVRESFNCATLDIVGLAPSTVYRYRVALDGAWASRAGTFRTAAEPGSARDFRVYVGSCAYTEVYTRGGRPYGANHHIFDTMAARMDEDTIPHFMLWLGDNLYFRGPSKSLGIPAEYASARTMALRYREVRAMLQMRRLFAATHHYAIWDDHDYGPDDSGRSFELKNESLELFRAYWPNPARNSSDHPGIWTSFRQEDAEFFLLDSRWNREADDAPPTQMKVQFGAVQLEWLKAAVAASKATFKVVAGGSQFLSQGAGSGWHRFPFERDGFLAWLAKEKPKGLVLVSGDRHHSVLLRHAVDDWVVHEFTCSPLTSRIGKLARADHANTALVKGTAVEKQNFGTLEFSGRGAARELTARCFDADGKELWSRVLASAD